MFIIIISSGLSKKITSFLKFQFTILLNQSEKNIYLQTKYLFKDTGKGCKLSANVKKELQRLNKIF